MRVPEAPSGCPIAIAPPLTLTISGIELAPLGQARERLGGERLVELDGGDVAPADPGARERAVGGLHRADPEHVGVDRVHAAPGDPRERLAAEPLAGGRVADPQRAGAVVERGGVARGDRPVLRERRPELRELLHRAVRPQVLVARELGVRHGDDPVVVEAALPRGGRPLVAADREGVLRVAPDLVDPRELLGARAERDRPLLGHRGVHEPPAERRGVQRLVAVREAALGLEHDPRRARHRLDAADEHERRVAGLDRAARQHRRVQRGAAQPVDGRARARSSAAPRAGPPSARRRGSPRPRRWRCRRSRRRSPPGPGRASAPRARARRGRRGRRGAPPASAPP